jgi:AcrR family transcriptional regulator
MATEVERDPETLRDRLVEAALGILSEEGIEALTLRSVARRAGVSHGAPARHFRSLADLRAEVAAVGFRLLSEAVEKSSSLAPVEAGRSAELSKTAITALPDTVASPAPSAASASSTTDALFRLGAAGRAYLDCALASPGLFALMFRRGDLDGQNPSLTRDSSAAFNGLLEHVCVAQAAGWKSNDDSRLLAGALWASIHGLATLWLQGAYQEVNPSASLDDAVATTMALSA